MVWNVADDVGRWVHTRSKYTMACNMARLDAQQYIDDPSFEIVFLLGIP
jgi:hypothetical protein